MQIRRKIAAIAVSSLFLSHNLSTVVLPIVEPLRDLAVPEAKASNSVRIATQDPFGIMDKVEDAVRDHKIQVNGRRITIPTNPYNNEGAAMLLAFGPNWSNPNVHSQTMKMICNVLGYADYTGTPSCASNGQGSGCNWHSPEDNWHWYWNGTDFIPYDSRGGSKKREESWVSTLDCTGDLPECSDFRDNDGDGKYDADDPDCENPSDDKESPSISNIQLTSSTLSADGRPGGKARVRYFAKNLGPDKAKNLVVTVNIPTGFQYNDGRSEALCRKVGNNVECPIGDLASGNERGVTVEFDILASAQCNRTVDLAGEATTSTTDPNLSNNSAVEDVRVSCGACNDGIDNDGDGLADHPNDPGCSSPTDTSERNPNGPHCDNGKDDDGDGEIDYIKNSPNGDLDCSSPHDEERAPGPDAEIHLTTPIERGENFIATASPWQNPTNRFDANGDGTVSSIDALVIINEMGRGGERNLGQPQSNKPPPFYDVNGDGFITNRDANQIIQKLNGGSGGRNTTYRWKVTLVQPGGNQDVTPGNRTSQRITVPGNVVTTDSNSKHYNFELTVTNHEGRTETSNKNGEVDGTACNDGIDNDGDGKTDHPDDPGCSSKDDTTETNPNGPECDDGKDNDGDNKIDSDDPHCDGPEDDRELPDDADMQLTLSAPNSVQRRSELTVDFSVKNNGIIRTENNTVTIPIPSGFRYNDGRSEGLCRQVGNNVECPITFLSAGQTRGLKIRFDVRETIQCNATVRLQGTHTSTTPDPNSSNNTAFKDIQITCAECDNGIDDDNDGAADGDDFSCSSPTDDNESDPESECQDGKDNSDDDGLIDLDDPGCEDKQDNDEGDGTSECQDGIDNDGDTLTDYPEDPSCDSPQDKDESPRDPVSDLSVTLSGPSEVFRTQQIVYTARAHNGGPSTANNVTVAMVIPSGLFFDDNASTSACVKSGNNVLCNNFTLASNQGRDIRIVFTTANVSTCGTIINASASVSTSSTDPNPNNNVSGNVRTKVDCAKCQDGIDNDNDGERDFPNDFSCQSPTDDDEEFPKAECQDGKDNSDNDGLIDLDDPGCEDKQDNDEGDGTSACQDGIDNDNDGFTDHPDDPSCDSPQDKDESPVDFVSDLRVHLNGPANVFRTQQVTYTLAVDNFGPSNASNVVATLPVPTGLFFDGNATDANCIQRGGNISCEGFSLNRNQSRSFSIVFITTNQIPCGGRTSAQATTASDSFDPVLSNNTSATVHTNVNCAECQNGRDDDNDGEQDFPNDFSCTSPTDDDETNEKSKCQNGIDDDGDGKVDGDDPGCDDNQDDDEENPPLPTDLSITLDGPDTIELGEGITYTAVVRNNGPEDLAQGALFRVSTPSGFVFNPNGSHGSCSLNGPTVVCTTALLQVNQSQSFNVNFRPLGGTTHVPLLHRLFGIQKAFAQACGHTIASQAQITNVPQGDPNAGNNQSAVVHTVVNCPVTEVDLSVTKTGPATAEIGQRATYTVVVRNHSAFLNATNVRLRDLVPDHMTFLENESDILCDANSDYVDCDGFGLNPGQSRSFTLVFFVTNNQNFCGRNVTNSVTVSSTQVDPDSNNNTSSVLTSLECPDPEADLFIQKFGPTTVTKGGTVVYTLPVTNFGPETAFNVTAGDVVPAGLTYNAGLSSTNCALLGNTVRCDNVTLLPGESHTFTVGFNVKDDNSVPCNGTISNVATVSTSTTDPNSANNTSQTVTSTVNCPVFICSDGIDNDQDGFTDWPQDPGCSSAQDTSERDPNGPECDNGIDDDGDGFSDYPQDVGCDSPTDDDEKDEGLGINKTVQAETTAGSQVTYTVTVQNTKTVVAQNVSVFDFNVAGNPPTRVDQQFTFVSAAGDLAGACHPWNLDSRVIECPIGNIPAGGSKTITLTFQTQQNQYCDQLIMNQVDAWETDGQGNLISGIAWDKAMTTVRCAPRADLTIQKFGPTTMTKGQSATYSLSVGNAGPDHAQNVIVEDVVPTGLTFNQALSTSGCSLIGNIVRCTLNTMGSNTNRSLVLGFDVNANAPCNGIIRNSATVSSTTTDPNTNNNQSQTVSSTVNCPVFICSDGIDNDQDGFTDWPLDPGCSNAQDDSERDPNGPECDNGIDDDGDGLTDYPEDVGCDSPTDDDEKDNGLGINKTVQSETTAGSQVTYTVTVQNTKTVPAQHVSVFDFNVDANGGVLPPQFTFVSAGGDLVAPCHIWAGNPHVLECPVGTIEPGGTRTITLTFQTPQHQHCDQLIMNQVDAWETNGQGQNISGIAWDKAMTTVRCEDRADLGVTKLGPSTIEKGQTLVYTIPVLNFGPDTAQNITIEDNVPTGLTFNSILSSNSCSLIGNTVRCTDPSLSPGQSRSFTLAFDVNASAQCDGTISNTVSVSAATFDPDTTNNQSDPRVTTVRCPVPQADLTIQKFGPGTVTKGETAVYTLHITNFGPNTAENVTAGDDIPAGLTFNPNLSSTNCALVGNTVRCDNLTLLSGDSHMFTVGFDVKTDNSVPCNGTITNLASVSASTTDPNPANNQSQTVSSTVNCPVFICSDGIDNDQDGFTDWPLDPGCSSAQDDSERDPAGPECDNGRDDDGDGFSDYPQDVGCDSPTDDDEKDEGLGINKSVQTETTAGSQVTYTVTVVNTKTVVAQNVSVFDFNVGGTPPVRIDQQFTFLSAGGDITGACHPWNLDSRVIECPVGNIPAGQSRTITLTFQTNANEYCDQLIMNQVDAWETDGQGNLISGIAWDKAATTVRCEPKADLSVQKAGPTTIHKGQPVSYTLTAINHGPDEATNVTVADDVPPGLTFNPTLSDQDCVLIGNTVRCDNLTLQSGGSESYTVVFDVPTNAPCNGVIHNRASVSTSTTDPNPGNNQSNTISSTVDCRECEDGIDNDNDGATDHPDDVSCSGPDDDDETNPIPACNDGADNDGDGKVDWPDDPGCDDRQDDDEFNPPEADLSVHKVGPTTMHKGQPLTYTVSATNHGPDEATNVTVADNVPIGLTFNPTLSDQDCALIGNTVRCDNLTLANGDSHSFTIVFDVPTNAPCGGVIENAASVSTSTTDPNPANNQSNTVSSIVDCRECEDGIDNDDDGATDFPEDVSCSGPDDDDETNPVPACNDGIDNDNDGKVDWPEDPGCDDRQDDDEFNAPLPTDLSISLNGPSTVRKNENIPYTATVTNVGPEALAQPAEFTVSIPSGYTLDTVSTDPQCSASTATTVLCTTNLLTVNQSQNFTIVFKPITIITQGDSLWKTLFGIQTAHAQNVCGGTVTNQAIITNVPQGDTNSSNNQSSVVSTTVTCAQCSDGIDNDDDGAIDFPEDIACQDADDDDEGDVLAQCQDGIDNDGDGDIDFPEDVGCENGNDDNEFNEIEHDLFITKSGPPRITRGNIIIYTLTATNLGPHTATNVHILDEIPAGLTFEPAHSSQNCVSHAGNIICNNFSLQNTESRTVNVAFRVGSAVQCGSDIRNVGIVNTSATDLNPLDNRHEIFTTVDCEDPTLNITKTDGRITAEPGEELTYTITIHNSSGVDAEGVDVSDNLPPEVEYISATYGPTVSNSNSNATTVLWSGLTVPAFQSITLHLTVEVKDDAQEGAVMLNTVSINGGASASDTTTVEDGDHFGCIEIFKIAEDFQGNEVNPVPAFTFWLDHTHSTVVNNSGYARFDNVPVGNHAVTEDELFGWDLIAVDPPGGNVFVEEGPDCAEVGFLNRESFGTQQPTYSITKTDNVGVIQPGQSLTYSIVVTNTSSVPATQVRVVDILPAEVTFVSASHGGALQGLDVVWDNLQLNPNQSITLTLTTQVRPNVAPGSVIVNVVQVIGVYHGGGTNGYAALQAETAPQATAQDTTTVQAPIVHSSSSSSSSSSSYSSSSYSSSSSSFSTFSFSSSSSSSSSSSQNFTFVEYEDEVFTNDVQGNNFEQEINPFSDTDLSTLEGQAAADLYHRNILGGFDDGEFKGERTSNRAELAKFFTLARYGSVPNPTGPNPFPDLIPGEWYYKYVVYAAQLGIVEGFSNGLFLPGKSITTAEFLAMFSRTFNLQKNLPHSYADASEQWVSENAGIAVKYDMFPDRSTFLRPHEPLTRKDIAIALYQYLKNR